ncbi:hypothetical protein Tco_0461788 [Tanacetum coccineum]
MPTKIELTLEQSQQGVSNDVLYPLSSLPEHPSVILKVSQVKMEILLLLEPTSNKLLVGDLQDLYESSLKMDINFGPVNEYLNALSWKPCQGDSLNLPDHRFRRRCCSLIPESRIHKPHAIIKLSKAQVGQESQIKMIQVKEMMQDNDLKNSKSKDKGSRSRSQSMNEQSHYKQDKTKTRQSINVKSHIFNVIGSTEEFEERDLNIGGDC